MAPFRKPPKFRFAPIKVAFYYRAEFGLTYRDLFVLWHLWDRANFKTNRLKKATQDKLAKRMGIQRSHLNESITRLEHAGFLERKHGSTGKTTEYQITHPPIVSCPENSTEMCPETGHLAPLFRDKKCPDNGPPFNVSLNYPLMGSGDTESNGDGKHS